MGFKISYANNEKLFGASWKKQFAAVLVYENIIRSKASFYVSKTSFRDGHFRHGSSYWALIYTIIITVTSTVHLRECYRKFKREEPEKMENAS